MSTKAHRFKSIYEDSKDKIFRLCLAFSGNDMEADDLFQEVYIKVWTHLDSFKNESQINTWIYKTATNTALLSIKKRNRTNEHLQQWKHTHFDSEDPMDSYATMDHKMGLLFLAISRLKEDHRIIISLVLENHSYQEISEIVGIPVTHVGVKINRIKKELKKKLKG